MILVHNYKTNIQPYKARLRGTTMAELPLVLWVVFVGIGMPLLSLTLITARYALFVEAAREAADAACSCQIFMPAAGSSAMDAVSLAQTTAQTVAATFPGISLNNVTCSIVVTPLAGGTSTVGAANTALISAPDPSQNLYQLQVNLAGQIQPMLNVPTPEFVNIPGLSAPVAANISMTRVFQNPVGLTQ